MTSESLRTIIEIDFPSVSRARKALAALKGELTFQGRAKASLNQRKEKVVVEISADDVSSLHATTSSYMRALKVITTVGEHVG